MATEQTARDQVARRRATRRIVLATGLLVAVAALGIGVDRREADRAAWSPVSSPGTLDVSARRDASTPTTATWTAPYVETPPTAPPATTVPTTTTAPPDPKPAEPTRRAAWYAPYVDLTLTPHLAFDDPAVSGVDDLVLGFVVADPADGCAPSWGGTYGLDEAVDALDLDARLAAMRQRGGDVIVSFGGAANDELAVTCADDARLVAAYRSVVDRYDLTTIDLDIEGDALADRASIERRSRAIAALQREARAGGRDLAVWLTLPVAPSGLDAESIAVVDASLAAGVDLAGVNVMTMSYGSSRPADVPLAAANELALSATHRQVVDAYARAGSPIGDPEGWGKVGATPMIGINDETSDLFSLDDARALHAFALDRGIGRLSIWSANRDVPCPPELDVTAVHNTCSGVGQQPGSFSGVLGEGARRPGG